MNLTKMSRRLLMVSLLSLAVVSWLSIDTEVNAGNSCPFNAITDPQSGTIVLDKKSEVSITYVGGCSANNNDFGFVNPATNGYVILGETNSADWETTFDVGTFNAGSEIKVFVDTWEGDRWVNGSGSRNSDGEIHADVQSVGTNVTKVSFESSNLSPESCGADENFPLQRS